MDPTGSESKTVQQHLEELSKKSFEGAKMSWDNENLLVTLPDGVTHIKVGFDEFSSDFTISTIIENPEVGTGSPEEKAVNKLQTAQKYIASYLADPESQEALQALEDDNPVIYEEITKNLNSYATIDDLIKALTNLYAESEYDEAVHDILELVTSANEGVKCKY